jgi:hypothetical protein
MISTSSAQGKKIRRGWGVPRRKSLTSKEEKLSNGAENRAARPILVARKCQAAIDLGQVP